MSRGREHEAAILALDAALSAALNARDIDRWLSHFAPDARMMPPGSPMLVGHDAIRRFISGLLTMPRFSMQSREHVVEVSPDGMLAWITYVNELTVWDADGKRAMDTGRTLLVWSRERGGEWRVVADIWNDVDPTA